MIPLVKLQNILSRYNDLEQSLSKTDIDKKEFVKNSKEYSSIGEIIETVKKFIELYNDREDLKKILEDKQSDKEIREMAEADLEEIKNKEVEYEKIIKVFFCQKMKQMKKMLLWKLEREPEVSKHLYLHLICLICIKKWLLLIIGE